MNRSTQLSLPLVQLAIWSAVILISGCAGTRTPLPVAAPGAEVGETPKNLPAIPPPAPAAAAVPAGYRVEIVAQGLIYPSSIEFDDQGRMYVAESGYVYGDDNAPARILRFASGRQPEVVAAQLNGPVTDILWHQGRLLISHRGKISALEPSGDLRDLVTDLPSLGDHHNNQLAAGPDGKIYFGQGTVTNSGVVGLDNFAYGWLPKHPDLSDIPAQDIEVLAEDFTTPNPLPVMTKYSGMVTRQPPNKEPLLVRTSPFQPFGNYKASVVHGAVKSNGTILRLNPDGSDLEVYAWGLRNPFGIAWTRDGKLYAADNGYDERGSRPIANAPDVLWLIRQGAWYGFPDYVAGIPVTDARFRSTRGERPKFLMKNHPPVEKPVQTFPTHSGVAKLEVSPGGAFGHEGHLFLAQVGSQTPVTGPGPVTAGFQVARIDPQSNTVEPFFRAKPEALGPQGLEYVATAGPKRPVDVRFSPDGSALYVVDIGAMGSVPSGIGPLPLPFSGTGVIWKISRSQ